MKQKFILFLKREGAYASFRKNISKSARMRIKNGSITDEIIGVSLTWSTTKEGIEFWRSLDVQWSYSSTKYMNIKDFYRYV